MPLIIFVSFSFNTYVNLPKKKKKIEQWLRWTLVMLGPTWGSSITLTMDRLWFNSRREDAPTKGTLHRIPQRWTAAILHRLRRIRQDELIIVLHRTNLSYLGLTFISSTNFVIYFLLTYELPIWLGFFS
jgi:hypothetical protein